MNQKLNVILLKTNDSSVKDRYTEYLKSNNINNVTQIKLLKFELINEELLSTKVKNLLIDYNFKSLILTSKQTIEAIDNVLNAINLNDLKLDNKLIVYCVGDATSARFRELIAKYSLDSTKFDIKQTKSEDEIHKQNAKYLSQLIISDFKSQETNFQTYAFYPCSSIRKDDLSDELTKANVTYEELKVYKTTQSESGLLEFSRLKYDLNNELLCLVFYSPSTVDYLFNSNYSLNILFQNQNVKIISVGPSTTRRLKQLDDNLIIFEMKSPTPQSLLDILKQF